MSLNKQSSIIEHQDIQSLLKNTKLNSISDIISFIVDHIGSLINFDPLDDLTYRVSELEHRQQGLDCIMIEEVRTIVEAMLDQREKIIRNDTQNLMSDNVSYVMGIHQTFQENTRKSLKQIDSINTQELSAIKGKKENAQFQNSHLQEYIAEMAEIRCQLERKLDRKEFSEMKNSFKTHSKEMLDKISVKEAEKIVAKFQQEVFDKLNVTELELRQLQFNLKKTLMESQNTKEMDYSKVKSSLQKSEKKIKKFNEEVLEIKAKVGKVEKCAEEVKQEFHAFEQKKYPQLYLQCHQLFSEMQNVISQNQQIPQTINESGIWISEQINPKSCYSMWQNCHPSTNREMFFSESKKTKITIVKPGYYQLDCAIFNVNNALRKVQPTIMLNTQSLFKIDPVGQGTHQSMAYLQMSQMIHIPESRAQISLKLGDQCKYSAVVLRLTKVY